MALNGEESKFASREKASKFVKRHEKKTRDLQQRWIELGKVEILKTDKLLEVHVAAIL